MKYRRIVCMASTQRRLWKRPSRSHRRRWRWAKMVAMLAAINSPTKISAHWRMMWNWTSTICSAHISCRINRCSNNQTMAKKSTTGITIMGHWSNGAMAMTSRTPRIITVRAFGMPLCRRLIASAHWITSFRHRTLLVSSWCSLFYPGTLVQQRSLFIHQSKSLPKRVNNQSHRKSTFIQYLSRFFAEWMNHIFHKLLKTSNFH